MESPSLRRVPGPVRRCTCRSCSRSDLRLFVPTRNARQTKEYLEALQALETALELHDRTALTEAHVVIVKLKVGRCAGCRASDSKSRKRPTTVVGVCREEWLRLKREVFHTCVKCGAQRAVQANHLPEHVNSKVFGVSDYAKWSNSGGIEAMRREALKCEPVCNMCHVLDCSSSTSGRSDPDTLLRENYATQRQYQLACYASRVKRDKCGYNDKLKRGVGRCERPGCPMDGPSGGLCVDGYERCFDWDHIDASTKVCAIADLCNDGYCFETSRLKIDAERDKCRLLCRNCHHTRREWDL
jgi:hypothetical protein